MGFKYRGWEKPTWEKETTGLWYCFDICAITSWPVFYPPIFSSFSWMAFSVCVYLSAPYKNVNLGDDSTFARASAEISWPRGYYNRRGHICSSGSWGHTLRLKAIGWKWVLRGLEFLVDELALNKTPTIGTCSCLVGTRVGRYQVVWELQVSFNRLWH